jgi:DNA-directed RNA polymerase II subunit RPB4
MSVPLPPPTHRKRALPQGELEAASTLKLGADQHTHTLSLSEARLVIHKVLENKRRGGNKYEEPEYGNHKLPGVEVECLPMMFFLQELDQNVGLLGRFCPVQG